MMPSYLTQQLLLSCWILSSSTTTSFSPVQNSIKHDHLPSLFRRGPLYDSASGSDSKNKSLWATNKRRKKGKPSMSERLKRRQEKTKGDPGQFAHLPPANINFSSKTDEDSSSSSSSSSKVEGASIQEEQAENQTAAAEKAKELLQAQRASVNMLTMVKERIIERLSDSEVRTELDEKGYAIVDDFFAGTTNNNDHEYGTTILTELQEEGKRMLQDGGMEVDTSNLGTGEYIIPIAGGEKQYVTCPRMVEIVVSATKHVPEVFSDEESDSKYLDLDSSACMATLRAFDRKALKASMSLLMGKEDDDVLDIPESTSPLKVITEGDGDDQRKLSLYYYIVPDTWDENCGGGLEFESGVAYAKRDRLVVLYSDTTKFKTITWKGSDDSSDTMIGKSIELHLVNKRK